MSAARQILNRSLSSDRAPRIPAAIDPATLPPQRTVIESKATGATFRVMRLAPRATFYAGCEDAARAVRLAMNLPDRCVVTTAANDVIFDNERPPETE